MIESNTHLACPSLRADSKAGGMFPWTLFARRPANDYTMPGVGLQAGKFFPCLFFGMGGKSPGDDGQTGGDMIKYLRDWK